MNDRRAGGGGRKQKLVGTERAGAKPVALEAGEPREWGHREGGAGGGGRRGVLSKATTFHGSASGPLVTVRR